MERAMATMATPAKKQQQKQQQQQDHEGNEHQQQQQKIEMKSLLSPTRVTRLQEKESLVELNDRLAAYIERVRSLEVDKARLLARVSMWEEEEEEQRQKSERQREATGGLRAAYDAELAEVRRALDDALGAKAALEIQLRLAQVERDEGRSRCSKYEQEWNVALGRIRDMEVQLCAKEASLSTASGDKEYLETEVDDLRNQLNKLEGVLVSSKQQLEEETLARVDLENRMLTLQEELEFTKRIHEQEIHESRSKRETHVLEIDGGQQQAFEYKLSEALTELRQQHEEQVQLYRQELDQTMRAKLEKSILTPEKQSLDISIREDLREATSRVGTLSSQLSAAQHDLALLQGRVRELEETLSHERDQSKRRLDESDRELAELREVMDEQLIEYEQLLDIKLALDMEIAAYRKLLEGEESRLNLSPEKGVQSSVVQTSTSASHSIRTMPGKRKRVQLEGFVDSMAQSQRSVSQHASASGSIGIKEVDMEGKSVTMVNNSEKDQPLGGWVLKRQIEDQAEIAYKFSSRYVLKAGQTVTIWAANAGVSHNPPSDLLWKTQSSWGTGDDIRTSLLNSDGEEVAVRNVVRSSKVADKPDEEVMQYTREEPLQYQVESTSSKRCLIM
uniref:Lamin-B1 isoform X1 n=2 Tax=Petromyzon marinus TaxID=7757 RepID=A0AAJ7T1A3_PETMA|nr:lamin-B1 isoform X1 [Petromyzon marinus]